MKVLVIEDSPTLRDSLEKGLRRSGCAVDTALDGLEGTWRTETGAYDVIVLDLMLPKVDGWTVLSRMRERGDATPVLVLTARDAVDDRVRAFDDGAQDYLIKPFAFAELLVRLRSLCSRSFGLPLKHVTCGDLTIDVKARRAWCGGHEVGLARREFMLLECLALRRGQVVSRSQIEQHLYDDGQEIASNAVDVAITRLRRKLEAHPGCPFIETRRGVGWVLDGAQS
jgi:DNA-binding response OmpR family regulator